MAEPITTLRNKKISRNKSKGKYKEYFLNNTRVINKRLKLEKHLRKHPHDVIAKKALKIA